MTFQTAYEYLKEGVPVKRAEWLGYWIKAGGEVYMHCKDGSVVKMSKGCEPMLTLENVTHDDWLAVKPEHRKELDAIHKAGVLRKG